jgi:hypothetical protein
MGWVRSSGGRYRTWQKSVNDHGCPPISIGQRALDARVWDEVCRLMSEPDVVRSRMAELLEPASVEADLAAAEKARAGIGRRARNFATAIGLTLDPHSVSLLTANLEAANQELRAADELIAEIKIRDRARQAGADLVRRMLGPFVELKNSVGGMTLDEKRALLLALDLVVRVHPKLTDGGDRVEIVVGLEPDWETIPAHDAQWDSIEPDGEDFALRDK